MLKRLTLAVLLAFASSTMLASPVLSQTKIGIGVGLNSGSTPIILFQSSSSSGIVPFYASLPITIQVPIVLSGFRIEPEFGLFSTSSSSTTGNNVNEDAFSAMRFAAGLYYGKSLSENANLYVGPRLGMLLLSTTSKNVDTLFSGGQETRTSESSSSNILLEAVIGGEYMLSQHFSLGAEAQLGLLLEGDEETSTSRTPAPPIPQPTPVKTEESGTHIQTNARVTARFYF
jgi:hypothetical protein